MIHKVLLLKIVLESETLIYFKHGDKKITALQLNNYITNNYITK